jgi:hypothetical protein
MLPSSTLLCIFPANHLLPRSVLSLLLPLYASHRALASRDPSALAPWLTYYVVLSTFLLVESYLYFLLSLLPFYAYLRLGLCLYLLLPQTRGAHHVYATYIAPFLNTHETSIEQGIAEAHDTVKATVVQSARQAVAWVRGAISGLPQQTPQEEVKPPAYGYNYVQSLLSRWNVPAASASAPPNRTVADSGSGGGGGGDWYALLKETVNQGLAMTSTSGTEEVSPEERVSFLAQQREKVLALMGVLEREERQARESVEGSRADVVSEKEVAHVRRPSSDVEVLKKVRSEMDFERVERDEAAHEAETPVEEKPKGWLPWGLGRTASSASATATAAQQGGREKDDAKAVSSAVDPRPV